MVQYFPVVTGSLTVSGSIIATGAITMSGSIASASYAVSSTSASYAANATSASYITSSNIVGTVANATSASFAVQAQTASFANSFTVNSTLTAQTLVVQTITSSVDYITGSSINGSLLTNTHQITGSLLITGSVGIGTSPSYNLDVSGVGRFNRTGTGGDVLTVLGPNGYSNNIFLGVPGTTSEGLRLTYNSTDGSSEINNIYNAALYFKTNATTRVTISSGGSMSVGTTSTQSGTKLLVGGGYLDVWSSANTLLRLNHDGTRGIIETFTGGSYSNTVINPNGGQVGIGTTSPKYNGYGAGSTTLTIQAASGDNIGILELGGTRDIGGNQNGMIMFYNRFGTSYETARIGATNTATSNAAGEIFFLTKPAAGSLTEAMRITSTSQVGIGTTNIGTESNLTLGPNGTAEGGQLCLQKGTSQASASFIDNYTNRFRVLSGNDTTSAAERFSVDMTSGNTTLYGNTTVKAQFFVGDTTVASAYTTTYQNNQNGYQFGINSACTLFQFTNGAPSVVATVNGGSGVYTALSDINKKKDLEDSTIGLDAIMAIKPTLYRFKDAEDDSPKQLGFIAQQVKDYIPQAYVESKDSDDDVFIGLQDRPIIAVLVKAIQELTTRVQELENK